MGLWKPYFEFYYIETACNLVNLSLVSLGLE